MHSELATMIDRLDSAAMANTNVIRWGSPVPSFGDLANSEVATLGLNPSNLEFMDEEGNELRDRSRRLHTLTSLGIDSWADVDARHLQLITTACDNYFVHNPYNGWFKRLDNIISGLGASYYGPMANACHLDLIPYATQCKWTELTGKQRSVLLEIAGDTLGLLLRNSPIRILILNGQSVVNHLQEIGGMKLEKCTMDDWSLRRKSTADVKGLSYFGLVDSVAGVEIGHEIMVLGFNHNIQSSFGVTTELMEEIRNWIVQISQEHEW